MNKQHAKVNEVNRVENIVAATVAMRQKEHELADVLTLTEADVKRAEATVQLLEQQQELLNRLYFAFNKMPSGINATYQKANPNGGGRY